MFKKLIAKIKENRIIMFFTGLENEYQKTIKQYPEWFTKIYDHPTSRLYRIIGGLSVTVYGMHLHGGVFVLDENVSTVVFFVANSFLFYFLMGRLIEFTYGIVQLPHAVHNAGTNISLAYTSVKFGLKMCGVAGLSGGGLWAASDYYIQTCNENGVRPSESVVKLKNTLLKVGGYLVINTGFHSGKIEK